MGNDKGFGLIGMIIVVAVIAVLSGGGLYFRELKQRKSLQQIGIEAQRQAEDLKIKIEGQQKDLRDQIDAGMTSKASEMVDTSNWKTYRNEKYGFEVKYPSGSEKPVEITESPFTGKYFRFGLLISFQNTNFKINVYSNQSFDDRLQEVTKTYRVIDDPKDFSLGEIKGKEIGINWGEGGKGKFILWQRSDFIFETHVSVESYGNGKEVLDILSTFKFIK